MESISQSIYYDYINILKQLFIIDEVKAWMPQLKSKNARRKASKKNFINPSIATVLLNLTPDKLLYDLDNVDISLNVYVLWI